MIYIKMKMYLCNKKIIHLHEVQYSIPFLFSLENVKGNIWSVMDMACRINF